MEQYWAAACSHVWAVIWAIIFDKLNGRMRRIQTKTVVFVHYRELYSNQIQIAKERASVSVAA